MPFGALPTRGSASPDFGEVNSGSSRRRGSAPPDLREVISGPSPRAASADKATAVAACRSSCFHETRSEIAHNIVELAGAVAQAGSGTAGRGKRRACRRRDCRQSDHQRQESAGPAPASVRHPPRMRGKSRVLGNPNAEMGLNWGNSVVNDPSTKVTNELSHTGSLQTLAKVDKITITAERLDGGKLRRTK